MAIALFQAKIILNLALLNDPYADHFDPRSRQIFYLSH